MLRELFDSGQGHQLRIAVNPSANAEAQAGDAIGASLSGLAIAKIE
jgi:hypothetical protein